MRAVHAVWAPAPHGDLGGDLLFWAEAVESDGRPSVVGLGSLRDLLGALGLPGQLTPSGATLLLPSRAGAPLPSARLDPTAARDAAPAVRDAAALPSGAAARPTAPTATAPRPSAAHVPGREPAGSAEPAGLDPWRVVGLRAPLAFAAEWLARLDEHPPKPELLFGSDLRFWSLAAGFALDLLARDLVVPAIERRVDGDFQAVWRPVLGAPADRRRLRALSEGVPPACRAGIAEGADAPVPPVEFVEGFLSATVDALARGWLAEAAWPEARWASRQGMPAGPARWLEALGANRPAAARLSAARASDLAREVAAWVDPALGARSAPFRAALRLRPPESGSSPTGRANGAAPLLPAPSISASATWRLDYLLQSADDPAVLVAAADVWPLDTPVARVVGRRVVEPQELLLADLARAAGHFPPIAASLADPWPTGADLTPQEAYAFLKDAAPLLADQGLAVLLPGWWTRGAARRRLKAHLAVHAEPSSTSGQVGLQALVDYDWQVALGDQLLSPAEFERLVAQQLPLVQLGGEWVELRADDVARVLKLWETQPPGGAMPLADALRLAAATDPDAPPVELAGATGWLEPLLDGARRLEELPEPAGFVGELRHYQRQGYGWLELLRAHGLGGCLAFDMGLGKTPTTIASLLGHSSDGPTLVVCPTTVLGNWSRELARFAPGLRALLHHGPGRADGETAFADAAAAADVVVTSYPLLHRDEPLLQAVRWATVVLDEAQNVKNPAARTSRVARRLPAAHRIALTGTPVENRLGELWAIMEFLNPGYLGTAEGFRRRFARPIEKEGDERRAEELRRLVSPFILRRLKTDPTVIQDLPEKLELKAYPPLTTEQASLYEAVVQDMLAKIADKEGVQRRGAILAALTKLKQVCNHPAHFLGDGTALAGRSGKLELLEEMLAEAVEAGDHTLIFTQFAEWGGRLRQHLQERLGRDVLYLHGGTPAPERDRLVDRFQQPDGPPVFVLSLRAGGTGLNLTRANRVVHYDRWWNPAVEAQATDRAFRIGQTRDVLVHAFICAGTLEERIDALIESKRALAESVVGAGESWLTELSTDDLRDIVTLRQAVIADA
jgi:superfamily II DNA or RNA helicase